MDNEKIKKIGGYIKLITKVIQVERVRKSQVGVTLLGHGHQYADTHQGKRRGITHLKRGGGGKRKTHHVYS